MRAPAAAGQTGPNPRTQSCPAARPAAPPKRTNVPGQQGRLQDLGGGRGGGGGADWFQLHLPIIRKVTDKNQISGSGPE